MNYDHESHKNYPKGKPLKIIRYTTVALILAVASTFIALKFISKPLISPSIQKSVTSTIFVPSSTEIKAKPETVKYDPKLKLLSYKATIFGVNSTISEQPTPENFVDIPQVYQKVLESWKQFQTFDTEQGTVYLTRPGDHNGHVVGVMNTKGTLMFVEPEKSLTTDQWHQFFNNLDVAK